MLNNHLIIPYEQINSLTTHPAISMGNSTVAKFAHPANFAACAFLLF